MINNTHDYHGGHVTTLDYGCTGGKELKMDGPDCVWPSRLIEPFALSMMIPQKIPRLFHV